MTTRKTFDLQAIRVIFLKNIHPRKLHCTLFTEKVSTVLFHAPSPVLEKFRRVFYPDSTDCPWVSEDENNAVFIRGS